MIKVGDTLPEASFFTPSSDGPQEVKSPEFFRGKKIVLFAVPGAFTPTCHQNHLPGYLTHHDALKAKGVDAIVCVAVNDIFVVSAWGEKSGVGDKVMMLADGSALFTKAVGLDLDLTERGLGVRSKRYAMIIEDGIVKELAVEDTPATADASGAEAMLAKL
ncbi:MAG: peroxiredoxin [Neomegalonema sp.]|nr:peroxiredoxin [Neomegalonema sp.]